MLYMVTFIINIPQMFAYVYIYICIYTPYMDPMGIESVHNLVGPVRRVGPQRHRALRSTSWRILGECLRRRCRCDETPPFFWW